MKSKLVVFSLLVLFTLSCVARSISGLKIAVISDIHIMAPELLQQEGKAFHDYVIHDRKMLKESPALLGACIDKLLAEHPDVVLVTGDLTKDGEKLSHEYVSSKLLRPLKRAGIKVFVIPGNHDVNNPHAAVFRRDTLTRTSTVTSDEFARYYHDYGYGQAIQRDPYSLSYVVQLTDSTYLLAIDACKYEENDFDRNSCVTGGRIKPETMNFIRQQVAYAKHNGYHILTMMHHGLVRHWKWQDKVMKDYLIDDWKKTAEVFVKLGLNIVFTGHFHAQDISVFGKKGKQVYDIETGSTVSYPMPYRLVYFIGKEMEITTGYVEQIPGRSADELEQRAREYAVSGISTVVKDMLPHKIPDEVVQQAGAALSEAYLAHLKGDEQMPSTYFPILKNACKRLRPYSWKYAFVLNKLGRYLFTDLYPADNNLTIHTNYAY